MFLGISIISNLHHARAIRFSIISNSVPGNIKNYKFEQIRTFSGWWTNWINFVEILRLWRLDFRDLSSMSERHLVPKTHKKCCEDILYYFLLPGGHYKL